MLAARLPDDDCQQIDTSAIPVKHTSRVRGADQWTGPGNDLPARFGRDAAHAEWFYGFRMAIKADLGSRIIRAWSIVPAAVNEREIAEDLLQAGPTPRDLLCDKGFNGKAFAARLADRGTAVLVPPAKDQRASLPAMLLKVIAEWRNRVETIFAEITDLMELARHGAHSSWGLLTRTAATIAAHTWRNRIDAIRIARNAGWLWAARRPARDGRPTTRGSRLHRLLIESRGSKGAEEMEDEPLTRCRVPCRYRKARWSRR
jgi:hypothetical protein